jgi:hypothetical protein
LLAAGTAHRQANDGFTSGYGAGYHDDEVPGLRGRAPKE